RGHERKLQDQHRAAWRELPLLVAPDNSDAQSHPHDLRRHAETQRYTTAAEATRDDHVTAVFDDVSVSETCPVCRRYPKRRPERQADLTAMCVTGDRQRDARGDFDK